MRIKDYLGNKNVLMQPKLTFLCSREITASTVLKCYDWAIDQRDEGNCVISGFHSKIEKDVFHFLLTGTQPVIMALARGMKVKLDPEIKKAVDNGKLLIVTPFDKSVTRVTAETSEARNRFMMELADEVVIGYASKGGMLEKILDDYGHKKITRLHE